MTKKHFIRAAEIVRETLDQSTLAAKTQSDAFVLLFREFNPRFDTNRFLVACGLVGAPVKAKGKRS